MRTSLKRRLEKIDAELVGRLGLCVSCLNTGVCDQPNWKDTAKCGKARADLPPVLFLTVEDIEQTDEVVDLIASRRRTFEEIERWEANIYSDAVSAGLDEKALTFIRDRVLGLSPQREGDTPPKSTS